MTFRGTVIKGVVVPDAGQELPEGMRMRLSPVGSGSRKRPSRVKRRGVIPPTSRKSKQHPLIALSGIWKNRPDWKGKSSAEIVAELRKRPGPRRS